MIDFSTVTVRQGNIVSVLFAGCRDSLCYFYFVLKYWPINLKIYILKITLILLWYKLYWSGHGFVIYVQYIAIQHFTSLYDPCQTMKFNGLRAGAIFSF
jgi:hypothetical protein